MTKEKLSRFYINVVNGDVLQVGRIYAEDDRRTFGKEREPIVCSGKLYSVQHRRSFEIKDAVCKIEDDSYIKDAIAPIFQSDDTNIIETFGNLDNAQNMKASLFLQWYPLWTLSLYINLNLYKITSFAFMGT